MFSQLFSRVIILVLGNLYPAYASFKAVKSKNAREYARWMMYWIVFALFAVLENFTDIFLSWFPFYYELKIVFVVWLLLPTFKGSSFIYRKLLHPYLVKNEQEIDHYIERSKELGSQALVTLGKQGIDVAQRTLAQKGPLWRSVSAQYLDQIMSSKDIDYSTEDQSDAGSVTGGVGGGRGMASASANQRAAPSGGTNNTGNNIRHRTNSQAKSQLPPIEDEEASYATLTKSRFVTNANNNNSHNLNNNKGHGGHHNSSNSQPPLSRLTFPLSQLEQDDINSAAGSSFTFLDDHNQSNITGNANEVEKESKLTTDAKGDARNYSRRSPRGDGNPSLSRSKNWESDCETTPPRESHSGTFFARNFDRMRGRFESIYQVRDGGFES